MSTIPANELVNVSPSVQGAGGSAVDVIALVLTNSARPPIGGVLSFPSAAAVAGYFGPGSREAQVAGGGSGLGSGYFGGFDGSNKKPNNILFAQYNQAAVAAFLRGGSVASLTVAQLQAIIGSLNVTIDGYPRNAASVDLSASTSFTSAAGIIQTALNAADPSEATVTASLGANFTASVGSPTTKLVVTAVTGLISVGDTPIGAGIPVGAKILSQDAGGTPGGAGTYNLSVANTASAASCTSTSNILNVSAVSSGTVSAGQSVTGAGVTIAIVTGQTGGTTGGIGTYSIGGAGQHVASESMMLEGTPVVVSYDSISGGFVITSGYTGPGSTAAFATGTISASLKLTSATGAVLSQGAAAAVPATFMNAAVVQNSNWVNFMTAFDPDGGNGNTVRQAFAAWKNTQNNRFGYVCFDTDASPTTAVPAAGSLGQILANNSDSGTCLVWEPSDQNLASFVCGAAASIDFTQRNGRISFAYKMQAGLVAGVVDPTVAQNLGGNPQTTDRGNGYNFYGAYANANQNFVWFQRGFVTGDFKWFDSYVCQVWFNSFCQSALLNLQKNSLSIPYSTAGNTLMESALADPIQAALNFGLFGPGILSAAQIANVNASAGANIAPTLQTQGYYLQILPADPSIRAARTSPPAKLWYIDLGSVQAINLASVALL